MQRITTKDGEQLAVRLANATSTATPMLTAHGLISSVDHWTFFNAHFGASRPLVSWDYRGHGGQPAPRDSSTISVEQFADDAYDVWHGAKLPPAIVVGLSFGVQVALEIWRRHPESVRALVLICGTPGHPLDRITPSPPARRAAARLFRTIGRRRILGKSLLGILDSPTGVRLACEIAYRSGGAHRDECPPSVLEGLFHHISSLAPDVVGNAIGAYLEHDASDVLPTITVPALVIAGDADELTPVATAERTQRAIRGSELVVFSGHSHLVQVEKPREVHAAIDKFLAARGL